MENKNHFGELTERMKAFREEVLDEKPYVDAERAIWATEVYKENLNQPRVMVRALMLKNILEKMTIPACGQPGDKKQECPCLSGIYPGICFK